MIDTIKDVTATVVDGLKSTPLLLAVLLLNAIMVGAALYFIIQVGEANHKRFTMLIDKCITSERR